MSWIKHEAKRINLNQMAEYRPDDKTRIIFYTLRENGSLNVFDHIDFDSEKKRDKALDQIDRASSADKITGESQGGGSTKIRGI